MGCASNVIDKDGSTRLTFQSQSQWTNGSSLGVGKWIECMDFTCVEFYIV